MDDVIDGERDDNNVVNQPGELQGKRQHWPGLAEERSSEDFPPLMTRVIRVTRDFTLKDDESSSFNVKLMMIMVTSKLCRKCI